MCGRLSEESTPVTINKTVSCWEEVVITVPKATCSKQRLSVHCSSVFHAKGIFIRVSCIRAKQRLKGKKKICFCYFWF